MMKWWRTVYITVQCEEIFKSFQSIEVRQLCDRNPSGQETSTWISLKMALIGFGIGAIMGATACNIIWKHIL
jgi:hypothetical protein